MPTIDRNGRPAAPFRDLSVTEVLDSLLSIAAAQTRHPIGRDDADSPIDGRPNLDPRQFRNAVNSHFFPRPLRGFTGTFAGTFTQCASIIDDYRDQQLAGLRTGMVIHRALNLRDAPHLFAAMGGAADGTSDMADGYPPAPLVVLSLGETKTRVKQIMAAQSRVPVGSITDDGPVVRPNILASRLRNALNAHFFPGDLHGFLSFLPTETVREVSERIKWMRDPQL